MVNDAMKVAQTTCDLFGLSSDNIQYIDLSNRASLVKYKGKNILSYLKLAMLQVNDLEFKFIQFVGGDVNSHKDFYDQYGQIFSIFVLQ